jgi:hypothetical protein
LFFTASKVVAVPKSITINSSFLYLLIASTTFTILSAPTSFGLSTSKVSGIDKLLFTIIGLILKYFLARYIKIWSRVGTTEEITIPSIFSIFNLLKSVIVFK